MAHSIPPGSTNSGAGKPILHPKDVETVLDEASSTKPTSESAPPPPYSPPLNSNRHPSPGLTARTPGPSAMAQVEVHLGGGMTPLVSITASVSAPMAQTRVRTNSTSASSNDSVSSDNEELESSGSDAEHLKGNYHHPDDNKRQPRAHEFPERTSPPNNQRPRPSSHNAPGQGSPSDRGYGADGTFDTVFGQGGVFETVFGPGGTCEREGNASQSTNFAHTNAYTHVSSTSFSGVSSSHGNPDADNAEYWAGDYDHPTKNMGRRDSLGGKGGSASSRDRVPKSQHRPTTQSNDRPRPTNQDNHRQGRPFASTTFFQSNNNVTINACNVSIVTSHNTTVHTSSSSSSTSPSFRTGGRRTRRNM